MAEDSDLVKLKKAYEKLQKKYKLPEFNKLDKEFEIRKVDPDLFILKESRRLIAHKLNILIHWLDSVLNPNPGSLVSMIESKLFSKSELHNLSELYKDILLWLDRSFLASMGDEKAEAEFLKKYLA